MSSIIGFGFKVTVHYTANSIFSQGGCHVQAFRNVTEVHYCYPPFRDSVAFESSIHGTGATHCIVDVAEFKVVPETERANNF